MSVRISFFSFPPALPMNKKRPTPDKCNDNKILDKKKPHRYSIADRVLQRCIKSYHLTPFDCVTDEAPHRQIPYKRRPFRGVRVFQISQDSLDYFLVAVQYLRKVVAIEHSEQILDISPSGVIRFLGPAFIEHLLSILHRPSSLGSVGVKHLIGGLPSQLLGKVISMGVYIPLIIRVISVCSSVVTTSPTSTHIRFRTIVLVTDVTLAKPSLTVHPRIPFTSVMEVCQKFNVSIRLTTSKRD